MKLYKIRDIETDYKTLVKIKGWLKQDRKVYNLICHDLGCVQNYFFSPETKEREEEVTKIIDGVKCIQVGCPRHPYSTGHIIHKMDKEFEFEITQEDIDNITTRAVKIKRYPREFEYYMDRGFNATYDKHDRLWYLSKEGYYDNGYGFYFHYTELAEGTKREFGDQLEEITVDGYDTETVEKELNEIMSKCRLWIDKDLCTQQNGIELENEDLGLSGDCSSCMYLVAIQQILEKY